MGFNTLAVVLVVSCVISQVSSKYLLDYWTNYWPGKNFISFDYVVCCCNKYNIKFCI